MANHDCSQCGKSAYGFPICPWCHASYTRTEITQQFKLQELPDTNNRVQRWRQNIYFLEFILIVIPVTIFDFLTMIGLAGTAGSNPSFSLQLFFLWIGGCMGTYALWSMYVRLISRKLVHTITELPWITLGCGIIANAVPVFYFIFTVTKPDQMAFVAFCLAFLAPAYVAIHWAFALLKTGARMSPQNELA